MASGIKVAHDALKTRDEHLEQEWIADAGGELLQRYGGKATPQEMQGCGQAAKLTAALDRLHRWVVDDSLPPDRWVSMARSYVNASEMLVTGLHGLSRGGTALLDDTKVAKKAGYHAHIAEEIAAKLKDASAA
jgi:hypothetical protein